MGQMEVDTFTALLRRHAGLIYKVAHAYCRNAADRDDVIQEIAIQLWRVRDRYDPRFRETTWIYRIAINVAISAYRRTRRHEAVPLDEPMFTVDPVEPPQEIARLLEHVRALPPLERALVLLYLDDHDHAAIAAVLGISVSNVGTKLQRIKARLRAAMEGGTDGAR